MIPLTGLLLAACASDAGGWPSLARRSGEVAPMVPRPAVGASLADRAPDLGADDAAAETVPAVAVVAIGDIPARLNTIARDIADLSVRLRAQRAVLADASARARGASVTSEAVGTAELERTRLDRVGGQIGDQRDRLDAIAGTLAEAAAGGADVAAQVRATGGLIARTRALSGDYDAAISRAEAATAGAGAPKGR